MTAEQYAQVQAEMAKGIPFSLSLLRSIGGDDLNIAADYCERRIPEPLRELVRERIDRLSLLQYALSKVVSSLADMQAQLDRIEAKVSQ